MKKPLTQQQLDTLAAFLDAFDQAVTGAWPAIEAFMADQWGIEDPESALEDARKAVNDAR